MASEYISVHQYLGELPVEKGDGGSQQQWVGTQQRTLFAFWRLWPGTETEETALKVAVCTNKALDPTADYLHHLLFQTCSRRKSLLLDKAMFSIISLLF